MYAYTDKNGKNKQKWEQFATRDEVQKRKLSVELEQKNGTFIVPDQVTVGVFLKTFIDYRARKLMETYAHVQEKNRLALTRRVESDFYAQGSHGQMSAPSGGNVLSELLGAAIRERPDLQNMLLNALLAPVAPDA